MNIIFFGSSHFSLPSLRALRDKGYAVSCVVTQPDRNKGRGLHAAKTVIKEFAQGSGMQVYQPQSVNSPEAVNLFTKLNPDLFVVIAYGQIFSQEVLAIPKIMPLNMHGSLLPCYRGAAPINWAIINGERETGVTAIKMAVKMDAGPVIAQEKINIDTQDTFLSLEDRLSVAAAVVLIDSLDLISGNRHGFTAQDETKATFAPKLTKADGLIDWSKPASAIYNLIRGCLGWPDAFTYYNKKLFKIHKAELNPALAPQINQHAGEIIKVSKDGILVCAKDGYLLVKELQLEGKRKMRAEEFIAGHKIALGTILGK